MPNAEAGQYQLIVPVSDQSKGTYQVDIDVRKYAALQTAAKVTAEAMVVRDDESHRKAIDFMAVLKSHLRDLKTQEDSIIRPFTDFVSRVRGIFKSVRQGLEGAYDVSEQKVRHFLLEQDRLRREEQARLDREHEKLVAREQKKAEKKGMSAAIVIPPPAVLAKASTTVSDYGQSTGRKLRRWVITKASLVPDEFWCLDEKAITQFLGCPMATNGNEKLPLVENWPKMIPGIEVVEDISISTK